MEQTAAGDPRRTQDFAESEHEVAGSPTLNLKVLQTGQETLVSLSGELDLSSAPALRELLAGAFDDDLSRLDGALHLCVGTQAGNRDRRGVLPGQSESVDQPTLQDHCSRSILHDPRLHRPYRDDDSR
jgi:hypothetical protein